MPYESAAEWLPVAPRPFGVTVALLRAPGAYMSLVISRLQDGDEPLGTWLHEAGDWQSRCRPQPLRISRGPTIGRTGPSGAAHVERCHG